MEKAAKLEAIAIVGGERVRELESRGLTIVWSKELDQLLERVSKLETALEIANRELMRLKQNDRQIS